MLNNTQNKIKSVWSYVIILKNKVNIINVANLEIKSIGNKLPKLLYQTEEILPEKQ